MKIACFFTVFNPTDNVPDNILALSSHYQTYVFDNSPISDSLIQQQIKAIKNVVYFYDGENGGIAKRLNQACKQAVSENFEWLLTMDQDSMFDADNLHSYINCASSYPEYKLVGMFGVSYQPRTAHSIVCKASNKSILITSGSLINLALYYKTKGFNEWMFIDQVDTDYCMQLILLGYDVVKFENVTIRHAVGTPTTIKLLGAFGTVTRDLHSAYRLFFMVRNFLLLQYLYKQEFPREIALLRKDLVNRMKNSIFYSKEKLKAVRNIFRGYRSYKKYKRNYNRL